MVVGRGSTGPFPETPSTGGLDMRLPRPRIENCCVHVTHRCQQRLFLLGTDVDRRQYAKRLWEASRRFPAMRVLDYVITANHRLCGAPHKQ